MRLPTLRYKRAWLGIGIFALAVIVGAIVFSIFDIVPTWGPKKTERPPVTTHDPQPTTLGKVRARFGPWTLAAPGESGAPALVILLESGGVDVSSWEVAVDTSWTTDDPTQITAVTAEKSRVTLQTDDGNIYVVGYEQPFILERMSDRVFAIRRTNSAYAILSTSVEDVHRLGHKL